MGGMAAQIPIKNDPAANEAAMERVRADKKREASDGHDGTWVAHPALIPLAQQIFDAHMPGPNQLEKLREDVVADRDALLQQPRGGISRAGFEANVEVCVRYLAAWLDGNGCVPIHWLMEDAATAEISRAQLWSWIKHGGLQLDDGTPIDETLFTRTLLGLPERLGDPAQLAGSAKLEQATQLLARLTHAEELADFLTLPAYELLA
jgi:malate synthase